MTANKKKRKLYRQLTGTEVPWFPHDNAIELLKELCHEAGRPRWVYFGTPAGGAGIHGCIEMGSSVLALCYDEHHRKHLGPFLVQRAVEAMLGRSTLVFHNEDLMARAKQLNLAKEDQKEDKKEDEKEDKKEAKTEGKKEDEKEDKKENKKEDEKKTKEDEKKTKEDEKKKGCPEGEEEEEALVVIIKFGLRFLLPGRGAEEEEGEDEGLRSPLPSERLEQPQFWSFPTALECCNSPKQEPNEHACSLDPPPSSSESNAKNKV